MHVQRIVTPKNRMTSPKLIKRACLGAVLLVAISAASAVSLYGETPDVWSAASVRLQSVRWDMDSMLAAANGSTDPVWLALLGLAFMGVLATRWRGN